MNNYVPFLKFKTNERGALSELDNGLKARTYPFFDLPKKKAMDEVGFLKMLADGRGAYNRHLSQFPGFFIDNYDVDDTLRTAGLDNYSAVLDHFGDLPQFVPVIGLDREPGRNDLVFRRKAAGQVASNSIAVRLQHEDFQSFRVVQRDLEKLQKDGSEHFSFWTIVFDNRVCVGQDVSRRSDLVNQFLHQMRGLIQANAVVIAGSSIPASIRDLLAVESEDHQVRHELSIYRQVAVQSHPSPIFLGDYTIVSPLYSDLDIPPEAMGRVIAAKTIYTYDDVHYIVRGGSLQTHARGRKQYNDIAEKIVRKSFYRGSTYSAGDKFLDEKARSIGKGVTPGSILKPTINTHITYMLDRFPG